MSTRLRVLVPATSANLGPGFDVFGLAVNLYNEFGVEIAEQFEIIADDQQILATKENLFYRSFEYLFAKAGKSVPTVRIHVTLRIPQGRGLGSSATAVVGGLAAANAFLGDMYSKEELLPFAIELEHGQNPDNVAPALFGGLVVVGAQQGGVVHAKVPFPSDIRAVYFIPDFEMSTVEGRKLMPAQYHKADVVFNTSRIALFMAALQTKRYELLQQAMDDKLHQPTRTRIFPAMPHIIQAANQAGALGAALSGGGSTIIALANQDFEHIAQAMKAEAAKHGVAGTTKVLEIVDEGVRVDND